MNNPDLYVSMALDDVIKHRRKEGGRGGRGGRGRGGRGGQQMFRNQMMPRGGGRGFGFPPRSPGRVMKQRMPNQGPRQNMPFRGGRGGPMPPRGFPQPQRGRGAPRGQFHPRMPMALTTNNPMNAGGRMRAWSSEVPNTRPLPVMAPPVRGRGRGGPRGIMRGRGRGMNRRMVQQQQQHFQQQQQQFQQQQQYIEPEYHQPQFQPPQPKPQMQLRQQPQRIRKPNLSQAAKVQIAQELKNSTKTARNRVRLAAQVLMQRKRQLEQLTMESAAADRQAAFKTRGVRLQGATQRVTGLRRGGGVVKRPVDARVAIRQKVVRMQKMHVPDPPQPPQPMPNRSLATAAVRRAAAFRRGGRGRGGLRGRGMRGGGAMRGQKPLTLHERFSNQTY